MSKTVDVPALRAFTYRGRQVVEGEMVSMVPIEAAAHARRKLVSLSKGRYPTREMRAAQAPQPQPQPDPEPSISPRRRRYRRRDLQADE